MCIKWRRFFMLQFVRLICLLALLYGVPVLFGISHNSEHEAMVNINSKLFYNRLKAWVQWKGQAAIVVGPTTQDGELATTTWSGMERRRTSLGQVWSNSSISENDRSIIWGSMQNCFRCTLTKLKDGDLYCQLLLVTIWCCYARITGKFWVIYTESADDCQDDSWGNT